MYVHVHVHTIGYESARWILRRWIVHANVVMKNSLIN